MQPNMQTKNTLYQWRRVARLAGRKKGRERKEKKMGDTLGSGCQFGVAKFNLKEGRALFFHFRKNQNWLKVMFTHMGGPH